MLLVVLELVVLAMVEVELVVVTVDDEVVLTSVDVVVSGGNVVLVVSVADEVVLAPVDDVVVSGVFVGADVGLTKEKLKVPWLAMMKGMMTALYLGFLRVIDLGP